MTDNGVKSNSVQLGKPKPKESFRVFLKKRNPDKSIDSHSGKVLVVHPGTSLEGLQKKISEKYEFQVSDLFIEHHGQLLQIDDIDEIQEGDTLIVSGVKLDDKGTEQKDQVDHQETAIVKANDSSDIKDTLLKLTNQLARLVSRLDERNSAMDGIVRQLSKNSEQSAKQYNELLQVLSSRPIAPANPPEVPVVQRPHAVSKAPRPVSNTQNIFTKVKIFTEHAGPIWSLKVFSDLLISGSSDKTIKIWDLTTFKLLKTLEGHTGIVHCLALNKGKHLVSGSDDKSIRVWSLNDMKCINALYAHDNTVCELQITDKYLFSGSYSLINVWNSDNYQLLTTLTGHNHWVYSMCLYDHHLFGGSHNMIKVWDIDTLKCVKTISTKEGKSIYSLASGGRFLLSGTYNNSIFVWDLKTFDYIKTLYEHQGCVLSLSVSGQYFFSGSYDTTVKVWSLETLTVIDTLHHVSKIEALLATDKYIICGGTDNTIVVWSWRKEDH